MFGMVMKQLVQLLQRPNPMEVDDPHTFWTFILDSFFAIGSLNVTPATINIAHLHIASVTLNIVAIHTASQHFEHLWDHGLRERYGVYEAWAVAFRALAYDDTEEESGTVSAKNSLQELLSQHLLPSHGLDLTEIKDAVDAEEFRMPPNPCWIARLTAEEIGVLEFPYEAARGARMNVLAWRIL